MKAEEFNREIVAAMNNGDTHAIPQVQRVAEYIRRTVFDPWADRMAAANPSFNKMDFAAGKSYFPRAYDKAKIEAEKPDFVSKALFPWLKSEQTKKAAAKERLTVMRDELKRLGREVNRFEGRLETLMATQAKTEARLEERAMEVGRAEKRAGVLEERAAEIAEDISEIEEFIKVMKEEAKDPAIQARVAAMEKDLAELRRAEKDGDRQRSGSTPDRARGNLRRSDRPNAHGGGVSDRAPEAA